MTTATTIQNQIGNRALTMIGAKYFVGTDDSLTFRIGRNVKGVTMVTIKLINDLYNISFASMRGTNYKVKSQANGVFADQLTNAIAEHTGMAVSL